MTDYRSFRRLLGETHGTAGLSVRHELFAHAVGGHGWRSKSAQIARTLLTALRDLARLICQTPASQPVLSTHYVAAVSMPGASGWGTLSNTIQQLAAAGITTTVILHPRLAVLPDHAGPSRHLSLRSPTAIWRAVLKGLGHRGKTSATLSSWAVRLALVRLELWRAAWRRTVGPGKPILLHNDFEVFAAAALVVERQSICLQHGLPSDEFFPCQASRQVVWSPACAIAYQQQGADPRQLCIAAIRPRVALIDHATPERPAGIALLSQSHATPILPDIASRLLDLAQALRDNTQHFQLLLHPEEKRLGHPYPATLNACTSHPPHFLFEPTAPRWLVVGLLSTALLDLAQRGHYVIGLNWPLHGQQAAQAIGRPPRQTADAAAVIGVFDELANMAARLALLDEQDLWLKRAFFPDAPPLAQLLLAGEP